MLLKHGVGLKFQTMSECTLSDIGVTSIDPKPNKVTIWIKEYKKEFTATMTLKAIQDEYPEYPIVTSAKLGNKRCFVELSRIIN